MSRIPIFVPPKPDLSKVSSYLSVAVEANQYSNYGPLYRQFQQRLADYFELATESVVLTSNATVALEAALATSDQRAQKWGLPSWTFAASGHAARNSGLAFGFLDVDSEFGVVERGLDLGLPMMGVAPFGSSLEIGNLHSMELIDAAASFDALSGVGSSMSNRAGIAVSLHATKSISAGEGGVFISKDRAWVERVRQYVSFGFPQGSRVSISRGTNGKFSESAAAFGLTSLDAWAENRIRWLEVSNWARDASESLGLKLTGGLSEGLVSPYWVIKLPSEVNRDYVASELSKAGVETRLWWESGLKNMPAFSQIASLESLVNTDVWARQYLGLPMFPSMNEGDVLHIKQSLCSALESI